MRRILIVLMTVLLVAVVFGSAQAASQNYRRYSNPSMTCTSTDFLLTYTIEAKAVDAGVTVHGRVFQNGSLIMDSTTSMPQGTDETVPGGVGSTIPSFPFSVEVVVVTLLDGTPVYEGTVMGMCSGAGTGTASVTYTDLTEGAGPDMVALPADAVVGTFTQSSVLYWDDNVDAATEMVMETGKSLWVLGTNTGGTFYKVLLSGHALWVPVGSVGPTYDAVWNGAPLPTTIVD
jgi:hypothetical protein